MSDFHFQAHSRQVLLHTSLQHHINVTFYLTLFIYCTLWQVTFLLSIATKSYYLPSGSSGISQVNTRVNTTDVQHEELYNQDSAQTKIFMLYTYFIYVHILHIYAYVVYLLHTCFCKLILCMHILCLMQCSVLSNHSGNGKKR